MQIKKYIFIADVIVFLLKYKANTNFFALIIDPLLHKLYKFNFLWAFKFNPWQTLKQTKNYQILPLFYSLILQISQNYRIFDSSSKVDVKLCICRVSYQIVDLATSDIVSRNTSK